MNKDIVVIGVNFYPEDTAIGLYSTQMAEFLVNNGFNVSVLTGFPYYPQWKIWDDYRSKPAFYFEEYKGIKIYRYKQYVPSNPNVKNRIIHMLSFLKGTYLNLRKIQTHNIGLVISIVPFTFDILLGLKLKRMFNCKLWVHIQDFEIDAALQVGLLKHSVLGKWFANVIQLWEHSLLKKADVLSTISFSMLEKLKRKTGRDGFYFPNWVDINFINPAKFKRHRYIMPNKFNVLYSGNIGKKQDWDLFIKVVSMLKDKDDIQFIVVGNGANKDWLLSKIKHLPNCKYYPPVPYSELPDLLCSADMHILFQNRSVIDSVMPSKILGMMASAKPSLVVGHPDSEVRMVFEESEGGMFLSSDNPRHVANAILSLKKSKSKREYMGKAARNYIINNYSKEKVLNRFLSKIRTMEEERCLRE